MKNIFLPKVNRGNNENGVYLYAAQGKFDKEAQGDIE